MTDFYVREEDGTSRFTLEDGSGNLVEEEAISLTFYLVSEEDGTSRFTLEDASGSILLETSPDPPPDVTVLAGTDWAPIVASC